MDDISIYGRTVEEVKTRLEIVLRLLQDANLKINISKCHFFMKEIEFLGFKVLERGIEPSEKKIEPIKKYPRLTTKKEVISYVYL